MEYDGDNLTLTTFLKNNSIYQHKMVTPMEFEALKTATNIGKHWSNNITGKKTSVKVKTVKSPKADIKKGRVKPWMQS